jgi:Predicted integral membrane protein
MLARDYRAEARASLKGRWLCAVLMTAIVAGLNALSAMNGYYCGTGFLDREFWIFNLLVIFVLSPLLDWGYQIAFYERLNTGRPLKLSDAFEGFKTNGKPWALMVVIEIFVFLWSLLLIVPGIIKALAYSMAPFILRENPEMKVLDAITESRKLMHGHKGSLFCLYLTFIGWFLLSALSLGIGFLWFGPYVSAATASFYKSLKPVSYIYNGTINASGESVEL